MKSTTLAQEFCQKDPVFILLNERLRLGRAAVALAVAVLSFIVLWLELALAGMPFPQIAFVVGFQALVIFPLAVILYYAVPDFMAKPFTVLEESDSIGDSVESGGESYKAFRAKMVASMGSFIWIGLAVLMIVYYWYYRLFTVVPGDPSRLLPDGIRTYIRIALLVIYTPLFYMGVVTTGRILVGLFFIGRFFHGFRLKANPMNPDGAGGIGLIGQMLTTTVLMATALGAGTTGLVYATLAAGNNPLGRVEIIILTAIYVVATPILFYSLMWSPHRALVRAREDALRPLAEEFQRVSTGQIPTGRGNVEAIKARTDHLVEIQRQYDLIKDTFPVWPLHIGALRGLVATAVLPGVSTLLSGLISQLWSTIAQALGIGGGTP